MRSLRFVSPNVNVPLLASDPGDAVRSGLSTASFQRDSHELLPVLRKNLAKFLFPIGENSLDVGPDEQSVS